MPFGKESLGDRKPFQDSTGFLDRPYCGPVVLLEFGIEELDFQENKWKTLQAVFELKGEGFEGLKFTYAFKAPNTKSEYYVREEHEEQMMFMVNHWLFYFCLLEGKEEREKWAGDQIDVPHQGDSDEAILKEWGMFMKQFVAAMEKVRATEKEDLQIKILGSVYTGSPRLVLPYYPHLSDSRGTGKLVFTPKERAQGQEYMDAKDAKPSDPDDINLDDDSDESSDVDDISNLDDADF